MTRDFFFKKNGESISDTGSYTLSEIRNVELKGKKSEMFQSEKSAVELFAPARTSSPHAVKENLFSYATRTPVSTTTSRRLRPLPPFAASAGRPPSRRWEAPALRSGRRPRPVACGCARLVGRRLVLPRSSPIRSVSIGCRSFRLRGTTS